MVEAAGKAGATGRAGDAGMIGDTGGTGAADSIGVAGRVGVVRGAAGATTKHQHDNSDQQHEADQTAANPDASARTGGKN